MRFSRESEPTEGARYLTSYDCVKAAPCATRANSSCSPRASWLIFPLVDEGRAQNVRATRANDRVGASPAFGIACTCDGDLENLAGSAVCRRATSGKRFLLRCRSSTSHFARGFRKDRGRDEEGDQSEPPIRAG